MVASRSTENHALSHFIVFGWLWFPFFDDSRYTTQFHGSNRSTAREDVMCYRLARFCISFLIEHLVLVRTARPALCIRRCVVLHGPSRLGRISVDARSLNNYLRPNSPVVQTENRHVALSERNPFRPLSFDAILSTSSVWPGWGFLFRLFFPDWLVFPFISFLSYTRRFRLSRHYARSRGSLYLSTMLSVTKHGRPSSLRFHYPTRHKDQTNAAIVHDAERGFRTTILIGTSPLLPLIQGLFILSGAAMYLRANHSQLPKEIMGGRGGRLCCSCRLRVSGRVTTR